MRLIYTLNRDVLRSCSGGSILSTLLETGIHKKYPISVLVRDEKRAAVLRSQGTTPILFDDLDDSELLQRVASEHDSMYEHCPIPFAEHNLIVL